MGRKGQNKQQKLKPSIHCNGLPKAGEGNLKLSPLRKNDLNKLVDKLLKVTSTLGANNLNRSYEIHLEMDKLLHKIMSIEEEINVDLPARDESSFENLTSWMINNGAKIEGVELAQFEDYGYGLKAINEVKEGDFMISVPRKLMMTTDLARKSELEYLVKNDTLLKHMPNIILALFLLLEKNKSTSFWESYIKALPSSYPTVMYFTPQQLEALKGSPVYESALKQCRSIARQYGYLHDLFQKSTDPASDILRDVFTYKQYRWAVSTVMTRQNLIPTTQPENPMILALIPYWDMGNHDNAKLTTDYNIEVDQSEYYSCRDFTAGSQVFMSYGARPNSDVFLHNGFVHMNNMHDGVRLRLGVSKSDPLVEARKALLSEIAVPHSSEFLLTPGPVEGKLLAFLRVFNMDKDQLEDWKKNPSRFDLLHPQCAVDTSIEKRMWQFLGTRIKLLLAAYPTSLEEDEKLLLTKKEMTPCLKLAVLLRLSEKRILTKVLAYVEDHLKQ
ncbi:actin-histidine N-methyltransferase isoform X1 [Halyomorpha halys]|uniref:actin-histidine N-methyltransferase isoform X1 n=1 Tax=Halyomorpha halys TaxID=286706 RepID=UPI0006D4FB4F|nr:histone-lysine N-methyltransferase setd3 isoform X1 [Halyomorpha halys]